jgi:hypothetical protein
MSGVGCPVDSTGVQKPDLIGWVQDDTFLAMAIRWGERCVSPGAFLSLLFSWLCCFFP